MPLRSNHGEVLLSFTLSSSRLRSYNEGTSLTARTIRRLSKNAISIALFIKAFKIVVILSQHSVFVNI
jgi:hypothetical protein